MHLNPPNLSTHDMMTICGISLQQGKKLEQKFSFQLGTL